ncbi:hypothetical protein JHK85_031878 [Glycine max]|nr:hypothetical protein JHK85_031878 [Glycine max]
MDLKIYIGVLGLAWEQVQTGTSIAFSTPAPDFLTNNPRPPPGASYSILYDGSQNSVLKRVSFVAGMGVEIEQRPLLLARWCKQYRNFEGEWGQRIIEREKGGRR